jgi:hypothetical protein
MDAWAMRESVPALWLSPGISLAHRRLSRIVLLACSSDGPRNKIPATHSGSGDSSISVVAGERHELEKNLWLPYLAAKPASLVGGLHHWYKRAA